MACSCSLKARLSGDGSRTSLDLNKLMKAGWCEDKKGKSYVFVCPSPEERRFKSSKDVATYLQNRNEYSLYSHCHCQAAAAKWSAGVKSSETKDEDYQPDTEEETGVSNAYDDTPVKAGMSEQALEPTSKRQCMDLYTM